ncbi:type II toxin-antitoxin system VapC family toxin [Deinococcus radiophilus]|uniref:PIN domain-containing protein n=1 Tax=Deinococcus radiophilus TaxID=32062 RepID=A0A431VQ49_9DEIO|nr:type II toxin-antitoxin system VapC family toxin [Deinococcus radiophilus]RTR25318.1 PIN domain-containing protein [Deinococcus radiophilus]UFA52059.1 type II toxin-antitoxin system VapC family toxin [Deinococcus radiophilus]
MTVLDASALLTYLFGEPGTDAVQERLPGSVMHTVNLAEVLSKLAERGLSPEDAQAQLEAAGLSQVITIDPGVPEDAYTVARLRPLTRGQGLSLGDRYCLALGQRLRQPVATMDRAWGELELGLEIEVLR